jgi:hypothetical protein
MIMLKKVLSFPLHPIFFGLYVVLAVVSSDPSTIFFVEGYRALVAILAGTLVLFFILRWFFKDWHRAGYLTTLAIFLIFIYGHLYRIAEKYSIAGLSLGNHWIILSLWAALILLAGSNYVWKRIQKPQLITQFFNIVAIAALIFPLRGTLSIGWQVSQDPLTHWSRELPVEPVMLKEDAQPDIYYVILDGYARDDILKNIYQYDNSAFTGFLQEQGFYVAQDSLSNYVRTGMSLPASLNFEYLDELASIGQNTTNWYPLKELISNNRVRRSLEAAGYQFITISPGFFYTEIRDSDHYLSPYWLNINDFEQLIFGVSAFGAVLDLGFIKIPHYSYQTHRERIQYAFKALQDIDKLIKNDSRPKFVFAHILIPHPPFVFDSQGNPIEPQRAYSINDASDYEGTKQEYKQNYLNQLIYTNTMIKQTIEKIMQNSINPPIIIIQADHGPGAYLDWQSQENSCLQERFSILNAYYFPDQNYSDLYPSISPVNSFRVIFDTYFGTQLGLLKDKAFYSSIYQPYIFTDVTDQSRKVCNLPDQVIQP